LPLVFTDLEVVMIMAVALIVVYIVGTYWKHRTLTSYARWFNENLSKNGKVKFASHGHAGLRIKYEGKNRNAGLREMHFALTLGARENLIYYPYTLFTHDHDKLTCWALLNKTIPSNLKIMRRTDKKMIETLADTSRFSPVRIEALEELGYVMYASDRDYARELASSVSLPTRLKASKEVEFIEFERLSSHLHVVAKLRKESLPAVVDLMFALGDSA
jgi:hypothetical protein